IWTISGSAKFLRLSSAVRTRAPPSAVERELRLRMFKDLAASHLRGVIVHDSPTDPATASIPAGVVMEPNVHTFNQTGEPHLSINPELLTRLTTEEAVELLDYHERRHFSRFQFMPTTTWRRVANEISAYTLHAAFVPFLSILRRYPAPQP